MKTQDRILQLGIGSIVTAKCNYVAGKDQSFYRTPKSYEL